MRHLSQESENNKYKIIAVDDEIGIIDSLSVFLKHSGYTLVGCTDQYEAIEKLSDFWNPGKRVITASPSFSRERGRSARRTRSWSLAVCAMRMWRILILRRIPG